MDVAMLTGVGRNSSVSMIAWMVAWALTLNALSISSSAVKR